MLARVLADRDRELRRHLLERGARLLAGAGAVLAAIQLIGAAARVVAGRWSDRIARRVHPLRRLSAAIAVSWIAVIASFDAPNQVFVPLLVAAGALSVSWNGLSFTAAAEYAGTRRSGTAIGLQQTIAFTAASMTAPAFGALVEVSEWRSAFVALAISPLLAWVVFHPLDRLEGQEHEPAGAAA